MPIIYWNIKNDFISFTFHGDRLGLLHSQINPVSFIRFNLGQIFYNNPVLVAAILIALIRTIGKNKPRISETEAALLYMGLPLIIIFTFISLFRSALPHWTGPAFICLIIYTGKYLDGIYGTHRKIVAHLLSASVGFFALVLILGVVQIKTGLLNINRDPGSVYPGKTDFTLDMYGWKQAGKKFEAFLAREGIPPDDHSKIEIVYDNWFPAAHLDYYIAHPLNIRLFILGDIEKAHKYFWINKIRKLDKSSRILYITDSRNYQSPEKFIKCFSGIIPLDTLAITRSGKKVKYVYLYDMVGLKCDTVLYSPHPGF